MKLNAQEPLLFQNSLQLLNRPRASLVLRPRTCLTASRPPTKLLPSLLVMRAPPATMATPGWRALGPCRRTRRRRALSWAVPWVLERISFISPRVNHILRVTKPNTKRATNICPNSLSQIGAYGLRYNSSHSRSVTSATPRFCGAPRLVPFQPACPREHQVHRRQKNRGQFPVLTRVPDSFGTQHIRMSIPKGITGLSGNDRATLQVCLCVCVCPSMVRAGRSDRQECDAFTRPGGSD
jgi:hypothetical protein